MDTKLIKQKILDLAIRGKLVPQNPADEPASILLERIKAEKNQLIKEGKFKKEKVIKDERSNVSEILFDIPSTWCWCQLSSILTDTNAGKSPRCENRPKQSDEWGVIKTTAIQEGYFLANENKVLPKSFVILENQIIYQGDILITRAGPSNRTGIICYVKDEVTNLILSDKTVRLGYIRGTVNPEYLTYGLNSSFGKKQIIDISVGMADCQVNISQDNIKKLFVPLPPLEEQKRIVTEIDRWFKWIDELEKNQQDLHTAIQQAKSKILDLAIHGKLVPQESEWKDVKLKTLASIISGVSYGKGDLTTEGITILRGGNIQDGEIVNCIDDVVISNSFANDNNSVKKGDIVLVASTGSQLLIGKTGYARKDYLKTQIGAFLRIIRPKKMNISDYLHYVFISDYYKNYIRGLAKGTNINNIKSDYLTEFVIPFPSEKEQEVIVTKIEELFTQLDKIDESLN